MNFSQSSVYNSLQTLVSLEEIIRQREEITRHKDTFIEMNDKGLDNNIDELHLHGVTEDEIETIENINTYVKKGRDLLSQTLSEYEKCLDEIQQTQTNIRVTTSTISNIKQQSESLSQIHEELVDVTTTFITCLLEKQESIVADLQTSIGLLICKKDKLEAILKTLATSYNILKNAPIHHTCPICITNEIDVFLEPCGHTLCHNCNKSTFCHICRTKIKSARRLFFS